MIRIRSRVGDHISQQCHYPCPMRSWLDRDLSGSPTVCKSGRSSSTASPDCTTKDRCWGTRRGYKVLPSVQLPGLLKQSAFATELKLMRLRSRKCILKIYFLFYFADFCCNKPTTSYNGTQNAVGFYTRWHMIRRNMCCCKLCEIVHSKCNVVKLLHLLGFRFIWNTFTFNVVIFTALRYQQQFEESSRGSCWPLHTPQANLSGHRVVVQN